MNDHDLNIETACIHAGQEPDKLFGGVSVPIYQSSTFAFTDAQQGTDRFSGKDSGYKYTRIGNPTTSALEQSVASLENGSAALATSSGMSAISTALMTFLSNNTHIVSTNSLYGPTRTFIENELFRFGVESTFVDSTNIDEVSSAIRPTTKVIYLETPANPTLAITDIKKCAQIAHKAGALLIVDNTFCSPILQKPLNLGADVVLHSMTKFINGHSDVVAGILVSKDPALMKEMHKMLCQLGGNIDPHQAWLVLRGIKSLALRVNSAQANAQKLAQELEHHPKIAWLKYPGLKSHPQHALVAEQMSGPGAIISFELKGGLKAGATLLDSVKVCTLAVSLGGIETLIQHPAGMTHACMNPDSRHQAGITDGLIRLSVGCENYADILKDLLQALDKI